MLDVRQTLMKKVVDMFIGQGVKDMAAFFARADNAQIAQNPQLMRHRGLAHAQHQAQISHTKLGVREQADNANSRWVGKGFEKLGHMGGSNAIEQVFFGGSSQAFVGVVRGANGERIGHDMWMIFRYDGRKYECMLIY